VIAFLVFLIYVGCQIDEDEHIDTGFIPVGEWNDGFGSGYNITETSVEYYSPEYDENFPAQNFTGLIEKAIDFSNDTGVIIIKITNSENIDLTPGKYTCIYYRDFTNSHAKLANPVNPSHEPIEVNTLNEALNLFTVGNISTHVTFWGSGYTK